MYCTVSFAVRYELYVCNRYYERIQDHWQDLIFWHLIFDDPIIRPVLGFSSKQVFFLQDGGPYN